MTDLENQCRAIATQIETGEYDFDKDRNDFNEPCASDYLSDALEIEYVLDWQGNYRGAIVLVAFGGPNIWIDTRWKCVRGAWWGESCVVPYHTDAMGLDETLEEFRTC